MNKKKISAMLAAVLTTSTILTGCGSSDVSISEEKTYTIETKSDGKTEFNVVTNPNGGETLSYSTSSGIELLEVKDGDTTYAFKDMDKDGELDNWEDWRLDIDKRAEDLAYKMSKEQIAGLMLFSSHERNIEDGLTEDQKTYLQEDNLRNILNAGSNNTEAAALWSNEMQSYVESLGEEGVPVIPVNFSSDPRSTAGSGDQYMVDGTDISLWPANLGLAATFNPDTVFEFAKISSQEYRGMGITTALGPQIDIATEPRWLRVDGTFGEDTKLTTDMTEAYVNGAQSSYDEDGNDLGWSSDSISVMIKHFPGDGSGEGGRESHMKGGKYAIYPGDNFNEHTIPFIEGGLDLPGKTKTVSSVMSSYSIGINKDGEAIMGMSSPDNGSNFSSPGLGEDGYYPLSLQYSPYTANGENVRRESIAGDILEDGSKENRSYYGKTSIIANEYDLDACLNTVDAVKEAEEATGKEIPVVVAMKAKNTVIMSEFEDKVDAIVVGFSISDKVLFDVILGKQEPNGLLPVQFPKDMNTVEGQYEDVAHDMEVYVDFQGNSYDFAYGLNYNEVINDKRTEKYSVK